MIVADTSTFISIASIDLLDTFLTEFDVHTTETVVEELEETSEYDDTHGEAADTVLGKLDKIDTHKVDGEFTSSRVDKGEGSCILLTKTIDAEFLITDDLRAPPRTSKRCGLPGSNLTHPPQNACQEKRTRQRRST